MLAQTEKLLRNSSYNDNLKKEEYGLKLFIKWCSENGWRYRINPIDSEMNKHGSDITIKKGDTKLEIDIKGCQYAYDTVALSYERSYDGVHWFSSLNQNKNTNLYVFYDEQDNMYAISLDDILFMFDEFEKVSANVNKAGHYNKVIKIPKDLLLILN